MQLEQQVARRLVAERDRFIIERYADQLGGGHFVPGAGRSGVATVAFRM